MASCCAAQGAQPGALWQVGGGKEGQEGGDMCIPMADSC